jgi:hypothetical protein
MPSDRMEPLIDSRPARHPVTGRFLAFDCERDCLDYCAGLCGVGWLVAEDDADGN